MSLTTGADTRSIRPAGDAAAPRRTLGLLVATAVVAIAVVAVLRVAGRDHLATPPLTSFDDLEAWLVDNGGLVAGFAVLRLVALLGAWYLVVVLALGGLAHRTRSRPVRRAVDLVTLPALRRLLMGAAGTGLATVVALPGAALPGVIAPHDSTASASPPPAIGERMVLLDQVDTADPGDSAAGGAEGAGDSGASETTDATATMRWLPPDGDEAVVSGAAEVPPRPDPAGEVASGPSATSWALAPGEHLWSVAETHLAESWGRPATDAEITPYWTALVDLNRPGLPDPANPDLVYPGSVVELPPVPAPPPRQG